MSCCDGLVGLHHKPVEPQRLGSIAIQTCYGLTATGRRVLDVMGSLMTMSLHAYCRVRWW